MSALSTCAIPPIETLASTDSTNLEARRRAGVGVSTPLWLRAETQTGGVGRNGRAWHSPPGNLYATLLMPLHGEVAKAALVSFVACLAVADTLDEYAASERVSLKWPNDALLDGKKIAGVLLEAGGAAPARWLSVGIGINLIHAPDDARWPPISLADVTASPPTADAAMDRLAAAFADRLALFETEGFAPIRAAWLSRAARLGQIIEARLPSKTVSGVFDGLAEDGALLLGRDSGEVRIAAADIHFPA